MVNMEELKRDSNEFYKIAFEYALSYDCQYVGDVFDIPYVTIHSLVKQESFIKLVEEIKQSFNGEDPLEIKKRRAGMLAINELERLALSKNKVDDKNKIKASELLLVMSKDLPKGTQKQSSQDKPSTSIKIAIGRKKFNDEGDIVDKEDWED